MFFWGVKILKRENILRMMMVMDADTCEYTTSIKMYFNMADLYGIWIMLIKLFQKDCTKKDHVI